MEEVKEKTTLKKNQKADIPTKNGGSYSYQYIDIAQIHEYLEKNNTQYYQYVETTDGKDYIMTVPIINGVEQKPRRGVQIVDAVLNGIKNPAQEQGSATTYARRYSLLMAFGLATEDDDGASLTRPQKEEITTKEQAEQYKIKFGKHAGKTIKELVETEKDYCNWLYKNEETDPIIKKCLNLMIEK